tara:strand:+ start:428 stop:1153 length:726 start_codon:yes stop_codon:yes gene_type:complete
MVWSIVGLDVENVAKNEVWDPSKGSYKEDPGDRFGNWLVGMLSGGSDRKGEIDKLVKEAHIKRLEDKSGGRIDKYGNVQGMKPITRDDLSKLDQAQLTRKLDNNKETKDALNFVAENYGIDPTEFIEITDPSTIRGRGARQFRKNEEEDAENKFNRRLQQQTSREDFLAGQANLRQDKRDERARLDRLENRRMTMETNRQTMQLEYARMAQNDRNRLQDKRDKALMLLIQGLGGVANAFNL